MPSKKQRSHATDDGKAGESVATFDGKPAELGPDYDEFEALTDAFAAANREDEDLSEAVSAIGEALESAFETVASVVDGNRRRAAKFEAVGWQGAAEFLSANADRRARSVDSDFQQAAREVVDAVMRAVYFAYPGHVAVLSDQLRGRRQRAEWAHLCAWHWRLLTMLAPIKLDRDFAERTAGELCRVLRYVRPEAEALTPADVLDALETTDRPSGFAGRLAVDCRAWGYESQETAQRSMSKYA